MAEQKSYISFAVAKFIKRLGYCNLAEYYYDANGKKTHFFPKGKNYPCITYLDAFEFLAHKNIIIDITCERYTMLNIWTASIKGDDTLPSCQFVGHSPSEALKKAIDYIVRNQI